MNDLIARIEAMTAKSTRSKSLLLLQECRSAILSLRPVALDWFDITTLPFPFDRGDHHRVDQIVWLANIANGEVRAGRPIRRKRDGRIGLFAEEFYPTHWMPFIRPNPPETPKEPS